MATEMQVARSLLSRRALVDMISSSGQITGSQFLRAEDQEVLYEAVCRDVVVL